MSHPACIICSNKNRVFSQGILDWSSGYLAKSLAISKPMAICLYHQESGNHQQLSLPIFLRLQTGFPTQKQRWLTVLMVVKPKDRPQALDLLWWTIICSMDKSKSLSSSVPHCPINATSSSSSSAAVSFQPTIQISWAKQVNWKATFAILMLRSSDKVLLVIS